MKKYCRTAFLRRSLFVSAVLIGGTTSPVLAQIAPPPPVRQSVDANGVDLISGKLLVTGPVLSIGSADEKGMQYFKFNNGDGWNDNLIAVINIQNNAVIVTINGRSDRFTQSGSNYVSSEGGGSKLSLAGSTYTYTASDGTVALFDKARAGFYPQYATEGRVTNITFPSGETLTYNYDSVVYCSGTKQGNDGLICTLKTTAYRLGSIDNRHGYRATFSYPEVEGDPQDPETGPFDLYRWSTVQGVTLKNRATNGEVSGTGFTNAAGQAMQFTYGASGITGVTYPGSTTADVTIGYSGARVSSVQTAVGNTTYASVDGVDNGRSIRTVTVTDPAAKATVYVFDLALERMLSRTDPLARKTQWTYDSLGRVTRITQPGGEYTSFVYDARGNVTETRQVARAGSNLGDIVSTASYPASCTNAVTCNQPTSTTAANGGVTDYEYDPTHGNVTKVTGPAASGGIRPATRYAYALKHNTTTGADIYMLTGMSTCRTTASCVGTADETTTTITYESGNLLPTAQTIAGSDGSPSATTAFGYDAIGNVTSIDGPLSGTADTQRITYDVLRRPTAVIAPDPDGAGELPHPIVRMTYDARGRISAQEQGSGNADGSGFTADRKVASTYDDANRKTAEQVMSGATVFTLTQFGYDTAGRLECTVQRMNPDAFATTPASACNLGVTGADGPDRITKATYNDAGQVTAVRRGDKTAAATEDQYAYHADGTLGIVTDGKGNVTAYTYDGFARPVRTCYQTASSTACAGSPGDYEQLNYQANGDLQSRRLRDGRTIGFTFDLLGRLTKKTVPDGCPPDQSTGCPPASATRDVDYGYDLLGHLTSATFSGTSEAVSATYDALGRMASTTTTMGGTSRTLSYAYDAAGNRTKLTHPDGMAFGYERDVLGRNTRITETVGTTTREVLNLAYYPEGTRSWFGHGANGRGHGYDKLGRLTGYNLQRNENGTVVLDGTVLEYNPASQIKRQYRTNDDYAWTGAVNVDRPYTTNGLNQYSAAGPATFEYDKNGNLTKSVSPVGGTQVYGYDAENRLVSGPNGVALIYDPLGRLFEIAQNGTVASRFVYDGDALVLEYDGAGNRLQRYVHLDGADTPVLSYNGTETSPRQLMPDHQGSIVSMTQHGWSRIAVNTYDEYGYPGATNTGRFQYTGQAWIAELGLYYYKARMYSPGMGRFLQTDPIGYGDGINWYNYVGGDPVNRTDPSGLYCANGSSGGSETDCKGKGGYVPGSPYDVPELPSVTIEGTYRTGGAIQSTSGAHVFYGSGILSFLQNQIDTSGIRNNSEDPDEVTVTGELAKYYGLEGIWNVFHLPSSPEYPRLPYDRTADPRNPAQTPNGCTNVPDTFPRSCNAHDVCYGTLGMPKNSCDIQFYFNMLAERPNRSWQARIYYNGVRDIGRSFYDEAQNDSKKYTRRYR